MNRKSLPVLLAIAGLVLPAVAAEKPKAPDPPSNTPNLELRYPIGRDRERLELRYPLPSNSKPQPPSPQPGAPGVPAAPKTPASPKQPHAPGEPTATKP